MFIDMTRYAHGLAIAYFVSQLNTFYPRNDVMSIKVFALLATPVEIPA